MKSSRAGAGFGWDPEPNERPVRFVEEPLAEQDFERSVAPLSIPVVRRSGGDRPKVPPRLLPLSRLPWHQRDIGRSSLRRAARALFASVCVCAFCVGWSFGASLRSAHAARDRAPAPSRALATAEVSARIQREVLK